MKGFGKVTTVDPGGDISSLFYDEFTQNVYVGYDTKIGKVTGTTITQLTGATGFTANQVFNHCRVGDYLFCCNGVDQEKKWDEGAGSLTNITAAPATWTGANRPKGCTTWNGRAFAWGVASTKDTIYYSKLYDVDTWTAGTTALDGGAIVIGSDGSEITACYPLESGLLIFKKNGGLYYFTGSATSNSGSGALEFDQRTFDYDEIHRKADCVGAKALASNGKDLFVWGSEIVWKLSGSEGQRQITVTDISTNKIADDVSKVVGHFDEVCAVHYPSRHQIWFSVAQGIGQTTIDTVHIYDYVNDSWMLRNGYEHKSMAEVIDGNGQHQIYTGGYDVGGFVYKQNSTLNYDGAAMECIFWTSWIALGFANSGRVNHVSFMLGQESSQALSYAYAFDFNPSAYDNDTILPPTADSVWNTTGSSTWGETAGAGTTGEWASGKASIIHCRLFGKGRRIQHRIYSNLVDSDFDILEIAHPVSVVGYT